MFVNNFLLYRIEIIKKPAIMTDNMSVNGLTHREIADILGITPDAVKMRLLTAGIKPAIKAGRTNLYSDDVVDKIREVNKGGRPKKVKK
jgi:predicted transcriptional regulator